MSDKSVIATERLPTWDELKDMETMVIVKSKFWQRVKDAIILIFRGKVYTNVTWQQLQDAIMDIKSRDKSPMQVVMPRSK